jgi:hypothetical protein
MTARAHQIVELLQNLKHFQGVLDLAMRDAELIDRCQRNDTVGDDGNERDYHEDEARRQVMRGSVGPHWITHRLAQIDSRPDPNTSLAGRNAESQSVGGNQLYLAPRDPKCYPPFFQGQSVLAEHFASPAVQRGDVRLILGRQSVNVV